MGNTFSICSTERDVDGSTVESSSEEESVAHDRRPQSASTGWWNQKMMFFHELRELWRMPQEDIDKFFQSHEVMGQERITSREDEDRVIDWYRVLNHFCALGNVEKMYIAPVLDAKVGNEANQRLFEQKMSRLLHLREDMVCVDLGCGKGRIANEVATYSGAKVMGLNYDKSQIDSARELAELRSAKGVQLEFFHGSFNDPLPFASASLDAGYEVGAFCYAIDKDRLFAEIYRVLKPGGRFSYCDWCRLNFDPENEHHQELLRAVKPMTGMVEMPYPKEVEDAFRRQGFIVEISEEACAGGKQSDAVIKETEKSFWFAEGLVNTATRLGLAPANLKKMWDRMREGGEALRESVELNLFTMTWHIVVRKPELPTRPA